MSRATGAGGAGADAESFNPSISANGRVVAFQSEANNLSSEDNNAYGNVFVRNLDSNDLTLVSRTSAGAPGDANSNDPSISGDASRVVFRSGADNFSNQDDNGYTNVFVRDLSANTTTFASRGNGADGVAPNATSFQPTISRNGRRVAFRTGADNISSEDNNAYTNMFVRDLVSGTTTLREPRDRARRPGGGRLLVRIG